MEQERYRNIKAKIRGRLKRATDEAHLVTETEKAKRDEVSRSIAETGKKPIGAERGSTLSGGKARSSMGNRASEAETNNILMDHEDEDTKKVARQLRYLRQNM
jgi:hypothetical protein